jgi:hypothetical protein
MVVDGGGSRSKDPVRITNVLNSLRGTPVVQVCLTRRSLVRFLGNITSPTPQPPSPLACLTSHLAFAVHAAHHTALGRLMVCYQAHGADHCVSLGLCVRRQALLR